MQSCQSKTRSTVRQHLFLLTVFLGFAVGATAKEMVFHVSPQGNDAWSGRKSAPTSNHQDGPLATLPAAVRAARAARAQQPNDSITILIHGGFYEMTEPLVLQPDDSGASAKRPLLIAAYRDEKPILSAGRQLRGWKAVAGTTLWSVEIPEVREGKWFFRQLWVNAERRQRARHPNTGYFTIAGLPDATPSWEHGHKRFQFNAGDIKAWPSATEGEVIAMTRWVESRLPITSIDEQQKLVTARKKSVFQLQPGDPYYVEHVFEALDQPGEWFLNRTNGMLYYQPLPGEKLQDFVAVAPRLAECLRIEGQPDKGRFVEHVQFRGLTFANNEWFFPDNFGSTERHISSTPDPEIFGFAQAAFGVPGAVRAEGARQISFERCQFANLGSYGLQLGRGCQSNRVAACNFFDLAAGGIRIGETLMRANPLEQAHHNEIVDCDIRDGGKMFHSGEGVWIGQSFGNQLTHNSIHDFFYTAVSIGWTWGYEASFASNNLVAFNHLHHVGQKANGDGPILSDMGGIYTLGQQPGTILRDNLIHDVNSHRYGGWGLYTDEGSSGILMENNVVYHCKNAGFHQHYGRENILRNNIIAFNREHQLMRTRAEAHISFFFTNNIVQFDSGVLLGSEWWGGSLVMDRNIYWDTRLSASTNTPPFATLPFAEWQKRGHDTNSVIADPQFVAAEKFDFHLKKTSPALKLGFQPIDLRKVGPRTVK